MNPYATHLPVLDFLKRLPIHRVLELGSGHYSTPRFLQFPYLTRLVSIETDQEWQYVTASKDPRHTSLLAPDSIEETLDNLELSEFDLIFVDAYSNAIERCSLIQYISLRNVGNALVVVHDYENKSYQTASRGFAHRLVYSQQIPNTAILWN